MKGYARDRKDDVILPFLPSERYEGEYKNYNFDDSPIYTSDGLKTKLRQSPLQSILHYQYKYSTMDGKYYILAIHFAEGKTHYSKYLYDNDKKVDGQEGEDNVMPNDIFNEIILMKNWIEEGDEQVISR